MISESDFPVSLRSSSKASIRTSFEIVSRKDLKGCSSSSVLNLKLMEKVMYIVNALGKYWILVSESVLR